MTERPILFSGPMVRALLAGRKTQRKLYAPRGVDPLSPEHLAQRLMRGILEINDRGCWIWGMTTSAGYGSMTVGGKSVRAHRLALALSLGKEERTLGEVCHRCDTPLCCNPDHLFDGTHGDNVRDAIAKGRARPPSGIRKLGETNGASKVTAEIVRSIRARAAAGETQQALADDYGISQSAVSAIVLKKRWMHV